MHAPDLPPEVLCDLFKLLQPACMNLDIVLMLKGDKNKALMCKLHDFEKLDKTVQTEFIKLVSETLAAYRTSSLIRDISVISRHQLGRPMSWLSHTMPSLSSSMFVT